MTWQLDSSKSHRDDRAVAPLIGFVLLFGMLVVLFSLYQAYSVPAQNHEIEFTHNQEVQNELLHLQDTILTVGATGSTQSATVTLGTHYPTRIVALNPPDPRGELEVTANTSGVQISNATVPGSSNAALYWDNQSHSYNTSVLAYTPGYYEYENAPTTRYENTLLYNEFESGMLSIGDQSVISGNDLSLTLLAGEFRETGTEATSVSIHPDSTASTTVPIESNGSGPVTLTLPTHLTANDPDVFLEASSEEHASDISLTDGGDLQVTLEQGQQYDLRIARVGINNYESRSAPEYITALDGTEVIEGQSFTVEARDQYNNPVSGTSVEVEGCGLEDDITNDAGQASFTCADVQSQQEQVRLSIDDGSREWEDVEITVNAPNRGGGQGNGNTQN